MSRNELVKKANQQQEYTPEQLAEFKKCSEDAIYCISNYFYVEHPSKGLILLDLFDYQQDMIKMFQSNRFSMIMCARQMGKSTVSAAYLLWYAMFNFNKTILIASDKNSNAIEIIYRIQTMYEHIASWLKPGVPLDGYNKHSLKLDNESRILSQATTEKTGRGMSLSLLFVDEFAFVGNNRTNVNVQEEFWTSISPTLSNGGSCIMSSTPNTDTDLFAQIWRGAESKSNGFAHLKILWDRHPDRDDKWAIEERGRIGEQKFRIEHLCEFLSSDALLISSMILQQIKPKEHIQELKDCKFWDVIKRDSSYILGIDPSTGSGSDFSVIEVFSFPEMVQVAELRSNTISTPMLYKAMKEILNMIDKMGGEVYYSIENNGVGEGMIALLENDERPPEGDFISESGKRSGMTTTAKTKLQTCLSLKDMVESNSIHINSINLITELKNFVRKRNSYEAKRGSTDDSISATMIVIRTIKELAAFDDDAFAKMYALEDTSYFDDDGIHNESDSEYMPLPFM